MCRSFGNGQGLGKEVVKPSPGSVVLLKDRNCVGHRWSMVAAQTPETDNDKRKAKGRKNKFLLQSRFSMLGMSGLSGELTAS